MNDVTVIIPTTGSPEVFTAIDSVLRQTRPTNCYVVIDGRDNLYNHDLLRKIWEKNLDYDSNFKMCTIPENVGANGFYGHRIYAAFTNLVNTKYVMYLDQDNWFDEDHVEKCISRIESTKSDWVYSLRKIVDKNGDYICNDDCESLGKWKPLTDYNHVDTNCYCIKTDVATKVSSAFFGGWGQDRVFYNTLSTYFPNYVSSGDYTCNYRLSGNAGSVTGEFFKRGNEVANRKYNGKFPWVN